MALPSHTHHCVLCPASCAGRTEIPRLLLTYNSWQNQQKEVRKILRNMKYENMKRNSSWYLLMERLIARILPQFKDFKGRTEIVTQHRKNKVFHHSIAIINEDHNDKTENILIKCLAKLLCLKRVRFRFGCCECSRFTPGLWLQRSCLVPVLL